MNNINLFTPRINKDSDERLRMNLTDQDKAKIFRGIPWNAKVEDTNTGRVYRVKGCACGIPRCRCDAFIVAEIIKGGV